MREMSDTVSESILCITAVQVNVRTSDFFFLETFSFLWVDFATLAVLHVMHSSNMLDYVFKNRQKIHLRAPDGL